MATSDCWVGSALLRPTFWRSQTSRGEKRPRHTICHRLSQSILGRARLQPCRKGPVKTRTSAPERRTAYSLSPFMRRVLIGRASRFLHRRLGSAFSGTEVFGQVVQKSIAVGVGDNGAEAFHFVEFGGPLLASQMLLGDSAGNVTLCAGSLDLGLRGPGRKRLARRAGRLRARQNDGCEQKNCGKKSLEQAGYSHTHGC